MQWRALDALARLNGGSWQARCGWFLGSDARTRRILDSLVDRGYVSRTSASVRYTITESGLNVLGWRTCSECGRLSRSSGLVQAEPSNSPGLSACSWCVPLHGGPGSGTGPPASSLPMPDRRYAAVRG
ncbi:hypothetical protein [Streptomyces sp. NBC_01304]|uniref:hypothetical protein n=1 Tax=Streptomyces sp. NBC_01304 TaxID=2903818 RepID=UPI002E14C6E5|nr:hypothetical protein OG430_48300 [Streptomyces sp. NBC_01304]